MTTRKIEEEAKGIERIEGKTTEQEDDLEKEPIIRMYGVNKSQNSVLVNIRGVVPYLFVLPPKNLDPSPSTL